jgi:hypothetical protein
MLVMVRSLHSCLAYFEYFHELRYTKVYEIAAYVISNDGIL